MLTILFLLIFFSPPSANEYGLPNGAKILETQTIPAKNRTLVLWMPKPKRNPRDTREEVYTCPEYTRGHYYSGKLRVMLIDSTTKKSLQTLEIESSDGAEATMDIPYKIEAGHYYYVPNGKLKTEAKPKIMWLRDYNGDGKALEFALFDAIACMGLPTSLIGYSEARDKVIQYKTHLTVGTGNKKKTDDTLWVDYLFANKPIKSGLWRYSIDYRGRGGTLDKYEIRFNTKLERFEGTLISTE